MNKLRCGLASVLASLMWVVAPAHAAQQLQLKLDGLRLPVDLVQLDAWSREHAGGDGDLVPWLNLLDAPDRKALVRLLRAPLVKERSFALQVLNGWTGQQLLREFGALLTQADGSSSAPQLESTMRALLAQKGEVTVLALLRALPAEHLVLHFDGLLALAARTRLQIEAQQTALRQLPNLRLPARQSRSLALPWLGRSSPQRLELTVPHRVTPLPLELWPAQVSKASPWLLLLPGLGGNSREYSWLAQSLAAQGWPVLVVEHPGSNGSAVQTSLLGDAPPPGAESLLERLADLQAVLAAQRDGQLPPLGPPQAGHQGVVLVGHSLGGLAALMAAGLVPERGIAQRCRQLLATLALTNPSRLLQCQLPLVAGERSGGAAPPDTRLQGSNRLLGVVAYNPFGSLLWPDGALRQLDLPVLMVGGSLDLVTPPVQEQLALFQGSRQPRSRLVVVEGASHFSAVRMASGGEALLRLGDELVGVEPRKVQELLLSLTLEFLQGWEHPWLLPPQRRQQDGVTAYVMDPLQARRWRDLIRGAPLSSLPLKNARGGPAAPPAGPPAR